MKILGKVLPEEKRDQTTIYKIIGILAVGVILLIVSSLFKDGKATITDAARESKPVETAKVLAREEDEEADPYEIQMEKRLKAILRQIHGVGEVEVMVTTTYGKEIVLAEDTTSHSSSTTEKDTEGGTRQVSNFDDQAKVVMKNNQTSSGNEPIVVKEKQPEIQGVLIIAQGAGNSRVKESITEAARTLLGIPAHRVTVHQLQS